MTVTRHVNLREAKAQLSRLADAAHQGATVVLTKRGRPWARLVPLEADVPPRRLPGRLVREGMAIDPYLFLPGVLLPGVLLPGARFSRP